MRRLPSRALLTSARAMATKTPNPFPTIAEAKAMPRDMSEVSGENLFVLFEQGNQAAIRECMRREIMARDDVSYADSSARLREFSQQATSSMGAFVLNGLGSTAAFSGLISIPLVFHFQMASRFNDYAVTADPPAVRARAPTRRARQPVRASHSRPCVSPNYYFSSTR